MAATRENALTLQGLLDKAETPEVLQHFLREDLKLRNVSDLISYVAKNSFEEEWKEIVAGAFPVRAPRTAVSAVAASDGVPARAAVAEDPGFTVVDQRLLISRMRSTHRLALTVEEDAAEDKAAARKEQYEADMEKPLDEQTRTRYKRQWTNRHAWEPVASMKGAPKLRNRVVREWQQLSMTNHTVEKCVSSLQAKRPVEPERVPIGPTGTKLIYETERPQTRAVHTLMEYIAALRLLMNVYAYCGTDLVPSQVVPGTTIEFFSYEAAIGYADNALHKVLEVAISESSKLRWLRLRDERTRAKMGHYINQGTPGGEALHLAWTEHQHLWDMEDRVAVIETREEVEAAPPPRPRSRSAARPAKKGKGRGSGSREENPLQGVRQSGTDNKKRKICGGYNSRRGCRHPCSQNQLHVCNILKPNNKVCEDKHHNAFSCPHARG